MKKKIISILLAMLIFVAVIPGSTVSAESTYCWPVRGAGTVITQDCHSGHTAIDIVGGTQRILAAKAGTVIAVYSGCNNAGNYGKWTCQSRGICSPNHGYSSGYCNWGYGRGVVLKHADGSGYSQYAHMSSVGVSQGQYVQWGQELGVMGNYGMSTGTHLHFSLTRTVSTENPNYYINFTSIINPYDVDYTFSNNDGTLITSSPLYFDGFTTNGAGKSFYISGANALLVCNIKSANNSFPFNRPQYGNNVPIVKYIGVELYKDGVYVAGKGEVPYAGTDIINVWYDVNSELGYTLVDGNYSYRFYAKVGTQTIYSEWRSFTYGNPVTKLTVTLDPNGGSVSPGSVTVIYGGTYGDLPVPTRAGYTFSGWTNLYKVVDSSSKVELDHDHVLYATWEHSGCIVTLDAGGGKVDVDSITVPLNGVYGELPTPTRDGYEFVGWFNDDEEFVTAESKIYSNEDHWLYADWTPKKYNVTFDAMSTIISAEVDFTEKEVIYDSAYGKLPEASKKGEKFLGWFDAKTEGNQITKDSIVKIPRDHTLYAYWETIWYKLYFDANGGEVSMPYKNIRYKGVYGINGILPTPTREGYKFLGWFESPEGGMQITDMMGYYGESDMTVYAQWVKEDAVPVSIEILSLPEKTEYEYGEEFSSVGLNVKITYSDGTVIETSNGFEMSKVDTTVSGSIPVIITSGDVSSYFGISVSPKPDVVTGISLKTLPDKLVYEQGEEFDPAGLSIEVKCEGGKVKYVEDGFELSGYDSSTVGTKNITLTYEGFELTFAVEVLKKEEPEGLLGDVNRDGVVNALDATQILRYANGKASVFSVSGDELSELKFIGDVNSDGTVNALDATQILRYANGKSSVLK